MEVVLAAFFLLPLLTPSRAATWDYRDINLIDHACYLANNLRILIFNLCWLIMSAKCHGHLNGKILWSGMYLYHRKTWKIAMLRNFLPDPDTNWPATYPTCGGSRQSPINIDKDDVFGADYSDFTFSLNYKILQTGTIENDGHTRT